MAAQADATCTVLQAEVTALQDEVAFADAAAAQAEATCTVLQGEVTTLQGEVTALQGEIAVAEGEANAALAQGITLNQLIGALAAHALLNDAEISALGLKEGDLQDQINNLKNNQDKPMQTSSISVEYFTGCDANNNPTYGTKTVSVIQGTEEAERLKFQQMAIADGATCKTGNGNGFANVLNEVRDIGAVLLNASEQTINTVSSGFNALQDDGILSEANWKYYPNNISLKAGILSQLTSGTAIDATTIANQTPQTATQLSQQINSEISTTDTNLQTAISNAVTQRNQEINS